MLHSLYHLEGYIIAHNHVMDYLDKYIDLKKEDLKVQVELFGGNNVISLDTVKIVNELKAHFDDVRKSYIEIYQSQQEKIFGKENE